MSKDQSEWRAGGANLAAAALAQGVVVIHLYSMGMFFEPLQQSFGWSRTLVASGLTVASIVAVIGAPFLGRLVDRVGPRKVGVTGIFLYCTAIASFSLMTASTPLFYALWIMLAVAALSVKTTVWVAEIVRRFVKYRGLAISIVISGTSIGAIAIPMLTRFFIEQFGWRGTYLALAGTGLLIAGPLVFFCFGKTRGEAKAQVVAKSASSPSAPPSEPLLPQLLSRTFFQLIASGLFCSLCLVAISVHLVPMLGEQGISRGQAAQFASLLGASALIGRLATGTLLDRLPPKSIGSVVVAMGGLGALAMLLAPSPAFLGLAVVLIGFSLGADLDIIAYLTAKLFGQANFATLFGIMVGVLSLCVGTGPLLAAILFDVTGSYRLWYLFSTGGLAIAVLLIATLPPLRERAA